ncbi:hypothetical protein DYBT9275_02432 [Dyadobacter sp. CECT 9275]|uniref:Uncharacterized protein n=1 Tax=Dyadobacter helix TaxID=2822344 RepID=A0A916N5W8_9BACT|nr:hypothetical protein [Dyadobacter sp. CECT 9275]CAG5000284.1 hypothetical protein DYBT9275_02432 [Dyadobacter sp. CECT 9275]
MLRKIRYAHIQMSKVGPGVKKWLPGLLFLAAQMGNTIYELMGDTRTVSWAPHTTQVYYRVEAYENGLPWKAEAVQSRYGIAQTHWESHSEGNLRRLLLTVEETEQTGNPDSLKVYYSRNMGPERFFSWKANK